MSDHHIPSQAQLDFYKRNGYLIIENAFSHGRCGQLLKTCDKYADKDEWMMNIETEEEEFLKVVKDPLVINLVENLLSAKVISFGSQLLFKTPGTIWASQKFLPHQDNFNSQARYGTTISVFLSLAKSDSENGGLYVYPGSHIEPILNHHSYEQVVGYFNEVSQVNAKYKKVYLTFEKGSLYFQHGHLIHGSDPNKSDRMRPIFEIMYIVKGEQYSLGKRRSALKEKYLEKVRFD